MLFVLLIVFCIIIVIFFFLKSKYLLVLSECMYAPVNSSPGFYTSWSVLNKVLSSLQYLQISEEVQEDKPESIKELVPPDPQGALLPSHPHPVRHTPRPQMRQYIHNGDDWFRQDRRPRSGDAEKQVVRQECHR